MNFIKKLLGKKQEPCCEELKQKKSCCDIKIEEAKDDQRKK